MSCIPACGSWIDAADALPSFRRREVQSLREARFYEREEQPGSIRSCRLCAVWESDLRPMKRSRARISPRIRSVVFGSRVRCLPMEAGCLQIKIKGLPQNEMFWGSPLRYACAGFRLPDAMTSRSLLFRAFWRKNGGVRLPSGSNAAGGAGKLKKNFLTPPAFLMGYSVFSGSARVISGSR